jgi:SAM-dependent methyltransferase
LGTRAADARGRADGSLPAKIATRWGTRAAELYTEAYAQRYRAHDDAIARTQMVAGFGKWLRGVCERFHEPIDVLDLGCGTGRYFHALERVERLVGIDVSRAMLDKASRPVGEVAIPSGSLTLVEADFLVHEFEAGRFDLVYSIGVLAEHSPLDEAVAARIFRWLKPGGRFAFTTVHPFSFSVPRTFKRRAGEWLLPVAFGALRQPLRRRLMSDGLYADEEHVRDVLAATGFAVESIEPFESDVHLHLLTVAFKH